MRKDHHKLAIFTRKRNEKFKMDDCFVVKYYCIWHQKQRISSCYLNIDKTTIHKNPETSSGQSLLIKMYSSIIFSKIFTYLQKM